MFAGTKADAKALEKKADADYKSAKETCKPMKGDEKKSCIKQAKATHEKAEAQAKGVSREELLRAWVLQKIARRDNSRLTAK